jgi:beta-glucosidase
VNQFPIRIDGKGKYVMNMKIKSDLSELSQTSMSISINNLFLTTLTIHGTNGEWIEKEVEFEVFVSIDNYLDLAFAQTGIDVDSITVTLKYMY